MSGFISVEDWLLQNICLAQWWVATRIHGIVFKNPFRHTSFLSKHKETLANACKKQMQKNKLIWSEALFTSLFMSLELEQNHLEFECLKICQWNLNLMQKWIWLTKRSFVLRNIMYQILIGVIFKASIKCLHMNQ